MIGSRLPVISEASRQPFQWSAMARDLLHMKVAPSSQHPLVFATTHLESLGESQARSAQIMESTESLGSSSDVIICGDTNINENIDGEVQLPPPWIDAWLACRPDDPGYTFDVERNPMLAQKSSWAIRNQARLRYDRFWVKLQNYALTDIELLDGPVDDSDTLWPSDHFGLLLTIEHAQEL